MALQITYNDGETDYTEAYVRVVSVIADHTNITTVVAVYADAATRWNNAGDILTILQEGFSYQDPIDGTNPIAQAYALLKGRSPYAGGTDV